MSYEIVINQNAQYAIEVQPSQSYVIQYSNERGPQGPPGVVPDDVVREWTDSDNNGTFVVVGMLALKLWDDDAEVYRDLTLVGNQLLFDNDPVAIKAPSKFHIFALGGI